MPELPEVEAVCRALRPSVGRRIVSARVLRCATPRVNRGVRNRLIESIDRRGKHILIRLEGGRTLTVHLRMSGDLFRVSDHQILPAAARVIFELDDGSTIVLEDRRALARVDLGLTQAIDAKIARELGMEPLSTECTAEWFVNIAKRSRLPAKRFLMDQRHVAGLGNIYAAEALFHARIDPRKAMGTLSRDKLRALHTAIVSVLKDAVQSAWNAYSGPGQFAEAETFPLAVFGREGEVCRRCRKVIRRIVQSGRSTYFCPGCQR
jgi:formamidopyrimidine-DNA glycosylase